jgi:hypothetical protein
MVGYYVLKFESSAFHDQRVSRFPVHHACFTQFVLGKSCVIRERFNPVSPGKALQPEIYSLLVLPFPNRVMLIHKSINGGG